MIDKIYEFICDNPQCGIAMNHIMKDSKKEAIEQARDYGHIIIGNKCYCDQKCYETRNNKT